MLDTARRVGLRVADAVLITERGDRSAREWAREVCERVERRAGRRLDGTPGGLSLTVQDADTRTPLSRRRRVEGIDTLDDLVAALSLLEHRPAVVHDAVPADVAVAFEGRAWSRDPATGSPGVHGHLLLRDRRGVEPIALLRSTWPDQHALLENALSLIEAEHRDMCMLEFVGGETGLCVTTAGLGSPRGGAGLRVLVDLVDNGLLTPEDALRRVPLRALDEAESPLLVTEAGLAPVTQGTGLRAGVSTGRLVEVAAPDSPETILLTSDARRPSARVHGVILTGAEGAPPPAPARDRFDCPAVHVPADRASDRSLRALLGEQVTIDGGTGRIWAGSGEIVRAQPDSYVARLLGWCTERSAITIACEAPPDYVRVDDPADVHALDVGCAAMLDLPDDAGPEEWQHCVEVLRVGEAAGVAARLCRSLVRAADTLPPAPWTHIVTSPRRTWAATVLAARLAIHGGTPGRRIHAEESVT